MGGSVRIGDWHFCPMVNPSGGPHLGGFIMGPGAPTVLIGGIPAAVVGDMAACFGPPDTILLGSTTVFFEGKQAARIGDTMAHGGSLSVGLPTVIIG